MPRKAKTQRAETVPKTPCYRVKIALPGAGVFYVLSASKPVVQLQGGAIAAVHMTPLGDSEHGDTLAYIRWTDVSALAWRPARVAGGHPVPEDLGSDEQ